MKRIQICQAEAIGSNVNVATPVIIEVSRALFEDSPLRPSDSLEVHHAFFLKEAAEIEKALYESLPGGTYDRLVGLFLQRKASHFIVSHQS